MRTVFISHSSEDLTPATALEHALARRGFSASLRSRAPGEEQSWHKAVVVSVSSTDCVVVLWSRNCATSPEAEFECMTAVALGKPVVVCLLDATPPASALSPFRSVSLENPERAAAQIEEIVRQMRPAVSQAQNLLAAPTAALSSVPAAQAAGAAWVAAPTGTAVTGSALSDGSDPSNRSRRRLDAPAPDLRAAQRQIGERFTLMRILGRGGMGAVYQAHDNELNRLVALKIIRPESAEDPTVVERFKREIQISSTITHENVLRVYDLGEGRGIKFLTMEYVDGENLAEFLKREQRLPVARILRIFRQICLALKAAHDRGVLHRDMKPANVMIDRTDRILLTDFGIAKSLGQTGLTEAGALVGTPHYMSPEQVKGETVDVRSDIYSLGVMLYEMAAGRVPFTGDTFYEVMMRRVQKDPTPAIEINPEVPPFVDRVIRRCMKIDKSGRYASMDELLSDLDRARQTGETASHSPAGGREIARRAMVLVPVVMLLAAAGWWLVYFRSAPQPAAPATPVSVLVADFDNTTGDSLFDGTLEETIALGLEGASFVTTFNRGRAKSIAALIKEKTAALDLSTARLVAQREGIGVIVDGAISSRGGYAISVRAVNALTGSPLAASEARTRRKSEVLGVIARLAADIRQHLGDTTVSAPGGISETFTAASLEAAHSYALAQELQGSGRWEEAIPEYEKAIRLDPDLGRAYAGLAVMCRNLGRRAEAEKYYQMAMARIDRMTDREKYRTRGGYFVTVGNHRKAIEEFTALVNLFPADFVGRSNLALSHFLSRNMAQALEQGRRAMGIYPRNVVMRTNLALYAMYAGDFNAAQHEARSILETNKSYGSVYVCLALSSLALGRPEESRRSYERLREVDESGESVAAFGLADLWLFTGQLTEAAGILEEAIRRSKPGDPAVERETALLASIYLDLGRDVEALAAAGRSSRSSQQVPVLFEAAKVYLRAGREDRALELASLLANRLEPEPQAYAKLIEAEAQLARGKTSDAVALCLEAQEQADTWLGRLMLGRAYLQANAFTEAYSEFDQCMKRRGEATAVFLDDIPTFHYLPPLYYYLGRAQQGLGSPAAAESYRTFVRIKAVAGTDPLVRDAQRRLAAL